MKTRLFAIAILAGAVSAANAAVLWDNNVNTNGRNGRAVSPPSFPNIRVVDDIVVGGGGWNITKGFFNILQDVNWQPGNDAEVYVYSNNGGQPGTLVTSQTGSLVATNTGNSYFGRPDYIHEVTLAGINLAPGTYWIGVRHPNASGSGTGYWMTSDGGPDGGSSSTGYYSLDGGSTWRAEGSVWHHGFRLEGNVVPEPATLLAIGAGLAALAARRRK